MKRDRDKEFLNPGPGRSLNHLMVIFETFYTLRSVASSREVKEKCSVPFQPFFFSTHSYNKMAKFLCTYVLGVQN